MATRAVALVTDRRPVWRITGPPENFVTAITRRYWALNNDHEASWHRLSPGDVLVLHSTRNSDYAEHARSTIIGYARVGTEKVHKSGYWWIQEVEARENRWPFAFSLDAICLFEDFTGRIDTSRPIEQKTREERGREATALSHSGIPIAVLEERARAKKPDVPGFPMTGSISRINEIYEEIILSAPSDGWFYLGRDEASDEAESGLLSDDDLRAIDEGSIDGIRKEAEAYKDQPAAGPQYGMRRLRKESAAQKRRVARLENYSCQVCNFYCEYRNSKSKRSWVIHVDHIVDKAHGGGEEIKNLWVLCPNCHVKKTCGVIEIDPAARVVREAGKVIVIRDNHLWR